MNKIFKFKCKQNQHAQVVGVLTLLGLVPNVLYQKDCVIVWALRQGFSRRAIERAMFAAGVPGAHSGKNKYRIIKGNSHYEIIDTALEKVGAEEIFIASYNGKLRKAKVVWYCSCSCCGPRTELVFL